MQRERPTPIRSAWRITVFVVGGLFYLLIGVDFMTGEVGDSAGPIGFGTVGDVVFGLIMIIAGLWVMCCAPRCGVFFIADGVSIRELGARNRLVMRPAKVLVGRDTLRMGIPVRVIAFENPDRTLTTVNSVSPLIAIPGTWRRFDRKVETIRAWMS